MSFVSFTNWRFAYLTVAPILAKADKLEPLIRNLFPAPQRYWPISLATPIASPSQTAA